MLPQRKLKEAEDKEYIDGRYIESNLYLETMRPRED